MASIFTFESEPPRVSSPWPGVKGEKANADYGDGQLSLAGMKMPLAIPLADCGITKLEAEPQEGPTEYKLHLLLRPRRSFSAISTVQHVSGSYLSKSRAPQPIVEAESKPMAAPALAPSSQSRQSRLQHLTTQLLWRLQQSSPYHSSSRSSLVLPVLPHADVELSSSKGPRRLIPGLEESSGALYEIGVSDDGIFVGLTTDELEESLTVLRAMAFSLGCDVQILRLIVVGDCQWTEETWPERVSKQRKEKLLVAEVLVAPHLGPSNLSAAIVAQPGEDLASTAADSKPTDLETSEIGSQSEQLRLSLTGSTTSGKSSLLGTLSTSTLDNGRGKSRLSLLKHRHEIVSGVTSSLAQELIGYQAVASVSNAAAPSANVINYASGNVSTWNDIHSASENGRLVFVTDSAGHPRYRRTTLRGLVSWAPHWTLCCVAADDGEDSTGRVGATASSSEILGSAGVGVDLSRAHLELCLKLNLPLVIVITKLDIASKIGLRNTLAKVLTALKAVGRRPAILSSSSEQIGELQSITKDNEDAAKRVLASTPPTELHMLVPIVFTSAVTGSGIGQLHALLNELPAQPGAIAKHATLTGLDAAARPPNLFHVDEVFTIPAHPHSTIAESSAPGFVLSGYLHYGMLEVGDAMLIGPCNPGVTTEVVESPDIHRAKSYPGLVKGSPRVAAISSSWQRPSSGDFTGTTDDASVPTMDLQTWQEVRATGIRNLRLPVRILSAGQVGTVAVTFQNRLSPRSNFPSSIASPPLRRGMVMTSASREFQTVMPPAYSRFTAVFPQPSLPAWPAVIVIVYIASIRASAKIVEVKALGTTPTEEDIFDFDDNSKTNSTPATSQDSGDQQTEITFEFTASQEWIEIGTQVLVTPGGGPSLTNQPEQREPGSAGLDGYVGLITQAAA